MGKTYTNPNYKQTRETKEQERQIERNGIVLGMILSGKANTKIMGDRRCKRSQEKHWQNEEW